MTEHLGEDAELYPLGILDDDAARDVERHIALCSGVRGARRTSASRRGFAGGSVARWPRRRRRWSEDCASPTRPQLGARQTSASIFRFALAAAVALILLGFGLADARVARQRLAAEDVALVTMVHSHFNHVSMSPQSANPVAAKILYARDGSWIYIIADKPGGPLHAIADTAAGADDLGVLASAGETATLLVHPRERIRSIVLAARRHERRLG